eukprot:scaffold54013_cov18-Tisochrysis_lutea.AAC.1
MQQVWMHCGQSKQVAHMSRCTCCTQFKPTLRFLLLFAPPCGRTAGGTFLTACGACFDAPVLAGLAGDAGAPTAAAAAVVAAGADTDASLLVGCGACLEALLFGCVWGGCVPGQDWKVLWRVRLAPANSSRWWQAS